MLHCGVHLRRADPRARGAKSSFSMSMADAVNLMKLVMCGSTWTLRSFTLKSVLGRIGRALNEPHCPRSPFRAADGVSSQLQITDSGPKSTAPPRGRKRRRLPPACIVRVRLLQKRRRCAALPRTTVPTHPGRRIRRHHDAQYALVREDLGRPSDGQHGQAELTVAWDADQSIYAFRGASTPTSTSSRRTTPVPRSSTSSMVTAPLSTP